MHKINVLAFGSKNFNTSLEEIKDYLSFKLITSNNNFDNIKFSNYDEFDPETKLAYIIREDHGIDAIL